VASEREGASLKSGTWRLSKGLQGPKRPGTSLAIPPCVPTSRSSQSKSLSSLSGMLVRALLVAGLVVPVASASASSAKADFGVSVRVVRSARVLVGAVAGRGAPDISSQLRAVPVEGGVNWVMAIGAGVQGAHTRVDGFSVSQRSAEGSAAATVRFNPGTGGAWDRADFGAALPDATQHQAPTASNATGEVAVFVPAGAAAAAAAPTYVVVTVMADRAL
jgi:hypothetical protein